MSLLTQCDEDDGICLVPEGSSQVLQYEYHIVYSCSYSTPVLFFRATTLGKFHVRQCSHTLSPCVWCKEYLCILFSLYILFSQVRVCLKMV